MGGIAFDPARARAAQRGLAKLLSGEAPTQITSVCGMDVSYDGEAVAGAAVVLGFPDLGLLEVRTVRGKAPVRYIPTFLAFREMCFFSRLMARLSTRPSVFMIDGHGEYHPETMGSASHFGVAFGVASIGVAKGIMKIRGQAVDVEEGEIRIGCRKVAAALTSPWGGRSYVSAGNRMTLDRALDITRSCFGGHGRPEPLFLADRYSRQALRGGVN